MTTAGIRKADVRKLHPIELAYELMEAARGAASLRSLDATSEELYCLHGAPFGCSARARGIWLVCGQATTAN